MIPHMALGLTFLLRRAFRRFAPRAESLVQHGQWLAPRQNIFDNRPSSPRDSPSPISTGAARGVGADEGTGNVRVRCLAKPS